MSSDFKVEIPGSDLKVTLNCKALNKDLARIIKELQECQQLHLLPAPPNDCRGAALIERIKKTEGGPLRRSTLQMEVKPRPRY